MLVFSALGTYRAILFDCVMLVCDGCRQFPTSPNDHSGQFRGPESSADPGSRTVLVATKFTDPDLDLNVFVADPCDKIALTDLGFQTTKKNKCRDPHP